MDDPGRSVSDKVSDIFHRFRAKLIAGRIGTASDMFHGLSLITDL